ncbi:hypothetical protein HMPREF3226_02973 [Prevotella corporis]|uniref:Uncharacterized protein n=1 Tax=Prevotella corporis TaxID=28128 RepID=A0A133PR51_9BACT|nr:hypothetical protein HMPREF3226_02973 [Prevotella corporis]
MPLKAVSGVGGTGLGEGDGSSFAQEAANKFKTMAKKNVLSFIFNCFYGTFFQGMFVVI